MTSFDWSLLTPAIIAFLTSIAALIRAVTASKAPSPDLIARGWLKTHNRDLDTLFQAVESLVPQTPVTKEVEQVAENVDVTLSNPVGANGSSLMGIAQSAPVQPAEEVNLPEADEAPAQPVRDLLVNAIELLTQVAAKL